MKQFGFNLSLLGSQSSDRQNIIRERARRSNLAQGGRSERQEYIQQLTRMPKKYEHLLNRKRSRSFVERNQKLLEVQFNLRRQSCKEIGPISSKQLHLLAFVDVTIVQHHLKIRFRSKSKKLSGITPSGIQYNTKQRSLKSHTIIQQPTDVRIRKSVCVGSIPKFLTSILPLPAVLSQKVINLPPLKISTITDIQECEKDLSFSPIKNFKKKKSYTLSIMTPRVRQSVQDYVTTKLEQQVTLKSQGLIQLKGQSQYNSPRLSTQSIHRSPIFQSQGLIELNSTTRINTMPKGKRIPVGKYMSAYTKDKQQL